MRILLRMLVALLAVSGAVLVGAGTASAAPSVAGATTCTGTPSAPGTIAPGTYFALTVEGACALPRSGTITVVGGVTVTRDSVLNAISLATFDVDGGIVVRPGGVLGLGCSPAIGCPATSHDRVTGGIWGDRALAVIVHSTTIVGSIALYGGGGGLTCAPNALLSSPAGAGSPTPAYSDFEDNSITGGVTVAGLHSCWFGFIRNHDVGTVTLAGDLMADPDANEVVTNRIVGGLVCYGNNPAPQVGDSVGAPNVVIGPKSGQCASLA